MELVVALEQEKIKFPHIPALLRELRQYRWDDKKLETDCVIALALAVHALELNKKVVLAASSCREPEPGTYAPKRKRSLWARPFSYNQH